MATINAASLSVADVARRFGLSNGTVLNMIRDGRLIAYRPSGAPRGAFRIPESECARHEAAVTQQLEAA